MRRTRERGLSKFTLGAIVLGLIVILTYLGFTKSIPFRHHYQVKAVFNTSNNIRPASFVRIAGVNVGKVTDVKHFRKGEDKAIVTMEIQDKGLPIHKDATVSVRPRIFLEGNFFIDIHPGTPSSPTLGDGDTVPASQTTSPVQLDQILTSLQSDTRHNLQLLLEEYSKGLSGPGGIGFNKSIGYWASAYKNSAIVNEATLGVNPHDLSGYIKSAGSVAAALDRNPEALKGLITNFNRTARAFAVEQGALEQTVAELPRTLRAARPALGALNASFPPVRRLIVDFRPAVRSSGPTIDASLPFVRQARALVSQAELRGLVSDLRPTIPSLARLNRSVVPFFSQTRKASACQNNTILPWSRLTIPDKQFPAHGPVFEEAPKFLPGISAESRSGDANGQWFRVLAGNGLNTYQLGSNLFGQTSFPLKGANPPKPQPSSIAPFGRPPISTSHPCEDQQTPDLRTEVGAPPRSVGTSSSLPGVVSLRRQYRTEATTWVKEQLVREGLGKRLSIPDTSAQKPTQSPKIRPGQPEPKLHGAGDIALSEVTGQ